MRTIPVDTDRLGTIIVREIDPDPQADDNGETYYRGLGIVPGTRGATEVRLRVRSPYTGRGGGIVRLGGEARITAWYTAANRGVPARTDITLSADQLIEDRTPPTLIGRGVPVDLGGPFIALGTTTVSQGDRLDVMLPPGAYDRDGGVVAVIVGKGAKAITAGQDVRLINAEVDPRKVDLEDAGRYGKASLQITAEAVEVAEMASTSPTRGRRNEAPAPTPSEEVPNS